MTPEFIDLSGELKSTISNKLLMTTTYFSGAYSIPLNTGVTASGSFSEQIITKDFNIIQVSSSLPSFTTGIDISKITFNGGYFDINSDKVYAFFWVMVLILI